MGYFSGCNNLVNFMFILVVVVMLSETSVAAEEENKVLYEFWSREEMVKSAGYGEDKLSTVHITGNLLCQSCFLAQAPIRAWPISGALVSINCNTRRKTNKRYWAKVVTDEYGDFKIDLPSHLHAISNLDKTCSINVLRIPKKFACRPTFVRKPKILKLSSVWNGNRIYTTGELKFQHLASRPLHVCNNNGNIYKQLLA